MNEKTFTKYQSRGAYHWRQVEKNIFTYSSFVAARYHQVISQLPRDKSLKVLDLGCGDGVLIYLASQKHPGEFTGVDTDALSLKAARRQLQNRGVAAKLIKASAYHLPFPENSFDVVIAAEVIEHLRSPQKMLTEAAKVLKPGGKMILTTPVKIGTKLSDTLHAQEFSPRELESSLARYFNQVDVKTSHPLWLKKLYLWRVGKLGRFYLEPFRLTINLWVMITNLNPFLLNLGPPTNQLAICRK
ncbi:MAG: Methyltransferase type 11 [Candidatus Beckwithbacteria bacterium GW2011_GWB1_47_15]|uniref:Methyltransferase type 11 n=1 Tax=Candidatus Beckwithbacteria bacterium GW2011_GWB1_47_15 TaxID=1618371 RepID=A0A0G1UT44_9BACT|nr:MAG: type 11 methyltransferase [Candidatus Beckwithbacteria bacterium GW2011_GWC1_49_16]KKU35706.1 MAG: Methyltransferase type 11 [Candidatus Beckwithbacteria bacterium GW2011_GWA1_46_30]KKU60905.1 MAG: Methyltransferase type 11 [Candidatus Beckwithbacteria bacterium GW2011_GWB1_47_15]KKU72265.1 MAG: Methyltransferase type 11 [Candidatus Beckwithbacteria bacterium GW2011_GWA2_47_25]KKW04975.1 MAG: Methyltransferase type 11 [Candidatus Beckwithbacteria bacterium GW2011_GWC2_49_11]OGD48925.1 